MRILCQKVPIPRLVRGNITAGSGYVFCSLLRFLHDRVSIYSCQKCDYYNGVHVSTLFGGEPYKPFTPKVYRRHENDRIVLSENDVSSRTEPFVDVFSNDTKCMKILAFLPGYKEDKITVKAIKNTLIIRAKSVSSLFHKVITLPVNIGKMFFTYNNGILEVTATSQDNLAPPLAASTRATP